MLNIRSSDRRATAKTVQRRADFLSTLVSQMTVQQEPVIAGQVKSLKSSHFAFS